MKSNDIGSREVSKARSVGPWLALQNGFTLLEVLIGTSLLSIMMLLVFGVLRTSVQSWDAGEKKIAEVNQAAVLQKFFKTYLESVRPLSDEFSDDEAHFSFQGQEQQLQFVASLPASAGRMGLQVFTITLNEGGIDDSKQIMVTIRPFYPQLEGQEWQSEEVVLVENIKSLHFSYFGKQDSDEDPVWKNEWLEMEALPLLINVAVELMDDIVWPDIVVSPKLSVHELSSNPFGVVDGKFTDVP